MILVTVAREKNTSSVMVSSSSLTARVDFSGRLPISVVVGIIIDVDDRVLVSQRTEKQLQGGRWEFPGGKVEPNESQYNALVRELREELGIEVKAAELFKTHTHHYDDYSVTLQAWRVNNFSGTPIGCEGQPVIWVARDELKKLDFLKGNALIIEALLG